MRNFYIYLIYLKKILKCSKFIIILFLELQIISKEPHLLKEVKATIEIFK